MWQQILTEAKARSEPASDEARTNGDAVVVEEPGLLEKTKETAKSWLDKGRSLWGRVTSPIEIEASTGDPIEDQRRQRERTIEALDTLGEVGVAGGETALEVLAGDVGDFTSAATGTTVTGKKLSWKERAVAGALAVVPFVAASQVRAGKRMAGAADELPGTLQRNNSALRRSIPGGVAEGYSAHHVIGIAEAKQFPVMHEAAELGYDINRGSNGIALPRALAEGRRTGLPIHTGRHVPDYTEYVRGELSRLQNRYDAGQLPRSEIVAEVGRIEARVRSAIEGGKVWLQKADIQ